MINLRFKQKIVNQVRKPTGRLGIVIAKGMNKGHAKLAIWGLSNINVESNFYILDIGCGGGSNIKRFANIATDGKIYGIDYSESAISVSKKLNINYVEKGLVEIYKASVSSLPFNENFFDLVSAFEAYYFWPNLPEALKEIYRTIKPNGELILVNEGYLCENQKKRKNAEEWARLGNFEIHSPNQYRDFLSRAGFSNIQIFEEMNKGWIAAVGKKI
jgi:SAM-dependent methyltransferase